MRITFKQDDSWQSDNDAYTIRRWRWDLNNQLNLHYKAYYLGRRLYDVKGNCEFKTLKEAKEIVINHYNHSLLYI